MATVEVELTQHEITFLSDALSMFSQGPNPEVRAYPDLLLKIGAAFLETGQSRLPVVVGFTEDELWMVREVSKTGVTVGSEKVGLNLAMKVYAGLRFCQAEMPVHEAVCYLGEQADGTDGPSKEDYKSKFADWAKGALNA